MRLSVVLLSGVLVAGILALSPGVRSADTLPTLTLERHPLYPEGADLALSGLAYDPQQDLYWSTSDNGGGKHPSFQPRLYQIKQLDHRFVVLKIIPLTNEDGSPARSVPEDPQGIDPEGITLAQDGTFWVVEEYGPAILRVSREGRIVQRIFPPSPFAERMPNRGLEGVALSPDGHTLYAALQSAPRGEANPQRTYIAAYDLQAKTFRRYAYDLTKHEDLEYPAGVEPTIGINGLEAVNDHALLVIERDNLADAKARLKRVYLIDLRGADDHTPAQKFLYADLCALGYRIRRPEGVAIRNDRTVVIVNDNDGRLGSPTEVSVLRGDSPIASLLISR